MDKTEIGQSALALSMYASADATAAFLALKSTGVFGQSDIDLLLENLRVSQLSASDNPIVLKHFESLRSMLLEARGLQVS
jgi:hypothetical protein